MSKHCLLQDYDFELPQKLIAQEPSDPRGSSRLLCVSSHGALQDLYFPDLNHLINAGDVLVFNDTKVIPAQLSCSKVGQESLQIDVNLLKEVSENTWQIVVSEDTWECTHKNPRKCLCIGDKLLFASDLTAVVIDRNLEEKYATVQFDCAHKDLFAVFQKIGRTPLPPYILRQNGPLDSDDVSYQTVYAKNYGAVAAPTAGLHFTQDMLDDLEAKGVERTFVTLHVGAGTFFPVKCQNINDHKIHSEFISIDKPSCDAINKAKSEGRRIIAVGTTALRVLESCVDERGLLTPYRGATEIFIREGYKFKIVDALITNFHVPRSTLYMLVCAFCGYETMKDAYKHAIALKYRFYSYGDACFLQRG